MTVKREVWVDNVKIIACIFVVLGHFFQSMTKSGVLIANDLYEWFIQTIYYFHVPLFFICSGYLYQKYSSVIDAQSWKKNILKKALNLGIPYFTFSFVTWILKTIFSGSVNDELGGLFETLLIHPTSPYWYLYALFFIFLLTPTFCCKKMAKIAVFSALVLKVFGIIWSGCKIQAVSYILENEIWFVFGMCMSMWCYRDRIRKWMAYIAGLIFLILSYLVYVFDLTHRIVGFLLGMLACFSVIGVIDKSKRVGWLAQYTMPIFLMHTLFAAPLRVVLFRIGIQNAAVHVVLGLSISIIGPVILACIMKKTKWLDFFLYPGKFIKVQ